RRRRSSISLSRHAGTYSRPYRSCASSGSELCRGGGRRLSLHLRHALLIERNEVNRIEKKRRKAAITHGGCPNLAGKGGQESRAFDHDKRLDLLLRYVLNPEHPCKCQVEGEQDRVGAVGLTLQFQRNFVIGFRKLLDADIDLNVDLRLQLGWRERAGRVWI